MKTPNQQPFNRTHSACNSDSLYHDVSCGHRIKTIYYEVCGPNCIKGGSHTPFICPECITDIVRTRMRFMGMSLRSTTPGTEKDRENAIEEYARRKIDKLIGQHHRPAVVAPKLDPLLMFFSEIDGAEDLLAQPSINEPTRKFKRPGKSASVGYRVEKPQGRNFSTYRRSDALRSMREAMNSPKPRHLQRPQADPSMFIGKGPEGVTVGDTPVSHLQSGTVVKVNPQKHKPVSSTALVLYNAQKDSSLAKVDAHQHKPHAPRGASRLREKLASTSADPRQHESQEQEDEDDATKLVRKVFEEMSLESGHDR